MTELVYLKDSYLTELDAVVISCMKKGNVWHLVLNRTIFYPQGGGQPSDTGQIIGKNGTLKVTSVRTEKDGTVTHEGILNGSLNTNTTVRLTIDWEARYFNMRVHSAGHIVHQAIANLYPDLAASKADHGRNPYIQYKGTLPVEYRYTVEQEVARLIDQKLPIIPEMVTYEELRKRSQFVPDNLPKNKPLRILRIGEYAPVPDGGTQVRNTFEVGDVKITEIENSSESVKIFYSVEKIQISAPVVPGPEINLPEFIGLAQAVRENGLSMISSSDLPQYELKNLVLGAKSEFASLIKKIPTLPPDAKKQAGITVNEVKKSLENAFSENVDQKTVSQFRFDPTIPGIAPDTGHLHIVTQAIREITDIFARIGFMRVRHPEVDWDWYAFESLNMPTNHPARDEWETFFIRDTELKRRPPHKASVGRRNPKYKHMVLTPHTSNGQVREMEKGNLPIRMINIAKCYRRQSDVSHAPMFHQFEGLYIDRNVSIAHLKGVIDYFAKEFYGPERVIRLRPFHFRFTEPSFEIDVTCGICHGKGCRLCKEGWLELGGAGMVHPTVLKNGGVDPVQYSGFAFGWGVERTYMMKSNTKLDDIRLLYSNDIRFLEQF